MLNRTLAAIAIATAMTAPAGAASLVKTYSYFSIGGSTLDEIESELVSRGPQVKSSGRRHPGATQMEFTTRVGYGQKNGACQVLQATVSVKAKVILPRWRRNKQADRDVRLIWDTLSSDIKRHEESHVIIAKNHAREMERALLGIARQKDCRRAAELAKTITARVLAKHDKAQADFDKVEGINFESRLLRLLRYRLRQIEAGRIPG